jgi:hypothetical protein
MNRVNCFPLELFYLNRKLVKISLINRELKLISDILSQENMILIYIHLFKEKEERH